MNAVATDWAQVLRLLETALDLAPADREPWLHSLHDVPAPVLAKLRTVLRDRAAVETGDFLDALPPLSAPPADGNDGHAAGDEIGTWRLLRPIGAGGMGTVWLAERSDGAVERKVALKMPRLGLDRALLAGRLAREGRILAALEHPHIARLYDAGATADGTSYMAMEYVDGLPIGTWCDARRLGIPARLNLFLQVLSALQYAHSRLVLHRDLKPGNVLVDAAGQVKLLDFGIAKLMRDGDDGGDATDGAAATALTELGGHALTPDYAAPEQLAGAPVGTACDIYALGVLLFELLTGHKPYRVRRDRRGEFARTLDGEDLPRPSGMVHGSTDADAIAGARGVRPKRLAALLRGDLDLIVLKALKTAPADRYATAQAFANDIARELAREPIDARPDSRRYRLRKLVRRNPVATGAWGAALAAVLVGASLALWQAERASAEAQRSQLAYGFIAGLFAQNDPQLSHGKPLTARQLLDAGAARLDSEFSTQPEALADLHLRVGRIYHAMSAYDDALRHVRRAEQLFAAQGRADTPAAIDALLEQGLVLQDSNDFDAMQAVAERGMRLAEANGGARNRWEPAFLQLLAAAQARTGNTAQAEQLLRTAMQRQATLQGEHSVLWLQLASDLAVVYAQSNRLPQAVETYDAVIRGAAGVRDYPITDLLITRYSRALALGKMGDIAPAERELREVVPLLDEHLGPGADRTVVARAIWSRALAELGRYTDAVAATRDNLAKSNDTALDEENRQVARMYAAVVLRMAGQLDAALPMAMGCAEFFTRAKLPPLILLVNSEVAKGDTLLAAGRVHEALTALDQAVADSGRFKGPHKERILSAPLVSRGLAKRADGRPAEGLGDLRVGCAGFDAMFGPAKLPSLRCRAVAAWLAAEAAAPASRPDAIAAHSAARNAVERVLVPGHPLAAELQQAESDLRRSIGQRDEAARLHEAAARTYQAALGQPLPERLTMLH